MEMELFTVRTEKINTYSMQELENNPIPIDTFNGKVRNNSLEEKTLCMLKVDKLIDVYSRGGSIDLVDPDDITELLNQLQEYLIEKKGTAENMFYKSELTEDDKLFLAQGEEFADSIFEKYKEFIAKDTLSKSGMFAFNSGKLGTLKTTSLHDNSYRNYDNVEVDDEAAIGGRFTKGNTAPSIGRPEDLKRNKIFSDKDLL